MSISDEIERHASRIDPAAPSTTKWWPIRDLLAEAMGLDPEEIYVATVSKPGNLKPRSEQSQRGVGAKVLVGMYTGRLDQLERCVASAEERCRERGLAILIFVDEGAGFRLVAVVKRTDVLMWPELAAAYPSASIIDS